MEFKEIERKFLVEGRAYREEAKRKERITQGFLCSVPERTVRVRMTEDKGWITVKGIGNHEGTTRFEWEREISGSEAAHLLELCEPGIIDKTRYYVIMDSHIIEVDEFHGDNEGLVVAEIELTEENEPFSRPEWLGKEVTGEVRYYNAALAKHPFANW